MRVYAALTLLLVGCAHVVSGGRIALERAPALGAGWHVASELPHRDHVLSLTVALRQENVEELEHIALEVSTPSSSRYGKHLSAEQVNSLVRPTRDAVSRVSAWLRAHRAIRMQWSNAEDFVSFTMRVADVERMLDVPLHIVRNAGSNDEAIRAVHEYTVPEDIAAHVDFVGHIHRVGSERNVQVLSETDEANKLGATPHSLWSLYNISKSVENKSPKNAQAVASFLKQYFHKSDLDEFFALTDWHGANSVAKVIGPDFGLAGVEASLDIEYIMAMGAKVPTWFWSTGGLTQGQEPFLKWIEGVANTSDVPHVFSVSYGDDEDSLSPAYMQRVNTEFAKMAARGISILVASGDSGVGCNQKGTAFEPSFPASSPWVTTVGGTIKWLTKHAEDANSISGGGFSTVFPAPSYQRKAVNAFLSTSKHLPKSNMFNASGRAYPDVAALSSGFLVVSNLVPMPGVAGTSCAAPTFSGIVSLLNDIRLQQGKAPLGFLNPLLYGELAGHLNDVTNGCNPNCNSDGFCAQSGWDASTGLGTPNYGSMADFVASLP